MTIIFWITAFIILLYLSYPLWLMVFSFSTDKKEIEIDEISSVSLVFLSYNGKQYLQEKIGVLLNELASFQHGELLIIDDCSADGSQAVLEKFRNNKRIRIILKNEHKGIPHSMNIGVQEAVYDHVVFCDQRQCLSQHILQRLVAPLKFKNIGATSSCISHLNKEKCQSLIRRHENFVKFKESKAGYLIGVYGPLYAIKKSCYAPIPEYIILDDLYLSLKILQTKQIEIVKDCKIVDDNLTILYDYKRTRRYLYGFLQILLEKHLVSKLNLKQLIMLFWHKYLRLLIPVLLFLCYASTAVLSFTDAWYLILFIPLTIIGFITILPGGMKIKFWFKNVIQINILYSIAFSDIFLNNVCFRRLSKINKKPW